MIGRSARGRLLVLPLAGFLCGAAADRASAPPPVPTVDATVRYRVAPSGRPAEEVTVSFSGNGRFIRIDAPTGQGGTVLDRDGKTITVIVPDPHVFMVVPVQGPVTDPFMLSSAMRYRRTGATETIAGTACDDWAVTTTGGDLAACVTATGILLRADGADGAGASGRLTALRVSLQPIPSDRFRPPAGWRRIAHPAAHSATGPGSAGPGLGNAGMAAP